jgi:ATP-binding cassette subfamily F protein 3
MKDNTILRFDEVSFEHGNKKILDEVTFNVRRGSKITLMGQNGAGKSTLFGLIIGTNKADHGDIHIERGLTIATARQVIPRQQMDMTLRDFFLACFPTKVYDIDPRIDAVLETVNLAKAIAPYDKIIRSFSGGQQARLLLASALIQNPDLLLLDEPTNNLDTAGIEHLTAFLKSYPKTCIVISHDAEFLNSFSDGVLYLDVHTKKIEQYVGNYTDVLEQVAAKMERDNMKNAQLAKEIQENKDKANFFANKGGQMRLVAKKMRARAEEAEEEKADIRKEDKTIRPFTIPSESAVVGELISITSLTRMKNHVPTPKKVNIHLKKRTHLLLKGPNGIGKSTLLERIAQNTEEGVSIAPGANVGYYRQDFSTLNFEDTVMESLASASKTRVEERIRATAAGFLITAELMHTKVGHLSEGQKGLVAFARLVLQKPDILILDEPTNHINFRHIPKIAEALNAYEGAMILVSHVPEFVSKIRIDQILDLGE